MRFYLLNSLLKLRLAKYSLGFILQAYLFAVIFTKLNRKMASQRTLATYQQNKDSDLKQEFHDSFARYILSLNNKKTLINHGNETDVDNSKIASCEMKSNMCLDASLLFGFEKCGSIYKNPKLAIVFNPYQNERYFGKLFWKSLIPENYRAIRNHAGKKAFPYEKNLYPKSKVYQKFNSKESVCLVDQLSKDKYPKNNKWASWEKSESSVSYQSNHLPDIPVRFTDLLVSFEKYYEKYVSVSMKTVENNYGFKSGNIRTTFNSVRISKEKKTSMFKTRLNSILSGSNYDSTGFKTEHVSHPFNCAVTGRQLRKTDIYKLLINAKLVFEGVIAKMILSNVPNDSDFMKDFKIILLKCIQELSEMENESKILATEEFSTVKNLSKLVLSIMQDDSYSDLQNLEDEVNCYYSNASNLSVNYENSNNCSTYWEYNEAHGNDELVEQISQKESSGTDLERNEAHCNDGSSGTNRECNEAPINDEIMAKISQNESSGLESECNESHIYESLAHIPRKESSGTDREYTEAHGNDEFSSTNREYSEAPRHVESLAQISQNQSSGTKKEYGEASSNDESLAQIAAKEPFDADYKFTNDNDEKLKILEGSYPMAKRTRGSSIDSGIFLDSNFEEVSPEVSAQDSELFKDYENVSTCKKDVSNELISELDSKDSSDVDSLKVCQICDKVVLNKFFLSNRFGLFLNCFHSFCYQCIRNNTKSKRLSTDPVACPKCGQNSPGIVSSPRWIRDSHEKKILFQEYEKESKFFHEQQQVFLKFVF